jgi:hypothetical protein
MKNLCQTRFLQAIAFMTFLLVAMPNQRLTAQDLTIPDLPPPPPTDPTIRGNNCSTFKPQVLSPVADKPITTTSAYPTFLVFVPPTTASQAEFVLSDRDNNLIYRRIYNLSGKSGILRVTLPTDGSVSELTVGQTYKLEFSLICEASRKRDDFAVSKVQRLPDIAQPQAFWERYRAIEYDGLLLLDAARRANAKDRSLQSEWEAWLVRHKLGDLKELPAIALK